MTFDVLIIGAGASGLLAGRELSAAGKRVMLLEANAQPGGRMHTITTGFSMPAEGGAEFIHGELEMSLQLARLAGIPLHPTRSTMFRVGKGNWSGNPMDGDGWELLMQKMAALSKDEPLSIFLSREFPGEEYARLRDLVRGLAEGYDLADPDRASTKDLYKEWAHEADEEEYRLEGGYGRLTDFLVDECKMNGCTVRFSTPVVNIRWQPGRVEATTLSGEIFIGRRVLVTVPLSVLQGSALQFTPDIPDQLRAVWQLGYGTVIKILLEFKAPFWSGKKKPPTPSLSSATNLSLPGGPSPMTTTTSSPDG